MELSIDTIKSAAFGGFEKESTLLYIRALMETREEECAKLQAEVEVLRKVNDSLASQSKMELEQLGRIIAAVEEQARNLNDSMAAENRALHEALGGWELRESDLLRQEEQTR